MDADGTQDGFDIEMIRDVRSVVSGYRSLPAVAQDRVEDFPQLLGLSGADAVLAASVPSPDS